jgi:hypothetical protein
MVSIIKTIIGAMSIPMTFIYAEKYEFNLLGDKVVTWPIAVLLPITKKKVVLLNNRVVTTNNLQLFFINKTSFLRDSESEALPVIEALDPLADEFLIRLGKAKKWQEPINKSNFDILPLPDEFDLPGDGFFIGGSVKDISNIIAC